MSTKSQDHQTSLLIDQLIASEKRSLYLVVPTTSVAEYVRITISQRHGLFQMLSRTRMVLKDGREFNVISSYERPEGHLAGRVDFAAAIDPSCPHDKAAMWRAALKECGVRETLEPV